MPDSLVLYGCNVAAGDAGAEFVERLHELTRVPISASATKTGSAQLGGDWLLQVQRGAVDASAEAELAFEQKAMAAYTGLLATLTVDDDGNGDHSTVAAALAAAVDGDTIVITGGADNIHQESDITVAKSVTITGDSDGATVDADGLSTFQPRRVFVIDDGDNADFQTVAIENLTITDGFAFAFTDGVVLGDGGGILNRENLTLVDSVVTGNLAATEGGGDQHERGYVDAGECHG